MSRIGLLSDSHGRAVITRQAVAALLQHDIDLILHLGDIGTVEVIDALAVNQPGNGSRVPARIVFGNTDMDTAGLGRYARGLGVQVDHPAGRVELGEGELVFCHGHQRALLDAAIEGSTRYLCHGHTHVVTDTRVGATRIINPGALCRATAYTVAVLDTASDELQIIEVG